MQIAFCFFFNLAISLSLERDWEALRSDRHARRDFFSRFSAIHSVELWIVYSVDHHHKFNLDWNIKNQIIMMMTMKIAVNHVKLYGNGEERLNDEMKIAMSFPRWGLFSISISCAHANEETNDFWICRNSVSERWKGEVSNESTSLKHWKMSRHFPRSELFLFCWEIREILFVLIQFFSYLPSFTNSPAVVVLKWSWKPSRYGKLRKIARRPRQLSLLKRNYIFI